MSVNNKVKFRKGMQDKIALDSTFIIKAIMLGKKEMKVNGVKALCASLKVFDLLAIAMHSPLIKNE